jgi:hypothetical protein
VAVNVTGIPGQILLSEAAIVTDGTGREETLIVIGCEIAVLVTIQVKAGSVVILQLTTSPSFNEELKKTGLFTPAFIPFIFH